VLISSLRDALYAEECFLSGWLGLGRVGGEEKGVGAVGGREMERIRERVLLKGLGNLVPLVCVCVCGMMCVACPCVFCVCDVTCVLCCSALCVCDVTCVT